MILANIQPGETGYDRFGPSPWHHAVNLNRFRGCGITMMNSSDRALPCSVGGAIKRRTKPT
jgi:hypothetical protein